MTAASELAAMLRAIRDAPDDAAQHLVLADYLIEQGDPRGELIVLDHHARAGELDPALLEQLLVLAAEYTFPCAREPDESTLPFVRRGAEHTLAWNGQHYAVEFQRAALVIDCASEELVYATTTWNADIIAATLAVISDAIRYGTSLRELWMPYYAKRAPHYANAARRIYRLPKWFVQSRGIARYRYALAARDYVRWNELAGTLRA